MTIRRAARPGCLLVVAVGLAACGSSYPSVASVRPDMEKAVKVAVRALGSAPRPTAVLHARCGPNDVGEDGDDLEVEQFGFPRPEDLPARIDAAASELRRLGLTQTSAAGSSPGPLLVMQPEGRNWTLVITTAATGGLVVNARGVVDEETAPDDLLPREGC